MHNPKRSLRAVLGVLVFSRWFNLRRYKNDRYETDRHRAFQNYRNENCSSTTQFLWVIIAIISLIWTFCWWSEGPGAKSAFGNMRAWILTIGFVLCAKFVIGTYRYYNSYLSYGSGDTIIQTYHMHGGTTTPHHKWNVECLDGEAMIGVSDWTDDFERFQQVWCKFMFPFKPPTNGLYPYYGGCHVRNFTNNYFCYNPLNATRTINTFVVGFWTSSFFYYIYRPGLDDQVLYKCCNPPEGYYIDYVSCYYVVAHDVFFEYYDNTNFFLVYCGTDFVMTGLSKKINPYTHEYHLDWIQCCRLGFGPQKAIPPPVTYAQSGAAAYSAPRDMPPHTLGISRSFQPQYRATRSAMGDDEVDQHFLNETLEADTEGLPQRDKELLDIQRRRIRSGKSSQRASPGTPLVGSPGISPLRKSLKIER